MFIRTHEKVRDEEEDRAGIRSQKKKVTQKVLIISSHLVA